MKTRLFTLMLAMVSAISLSSLAKAAETGDASPYDTNPACMDRTTDASTGPCVPKVEGTPRHTYPSTRAPGSSAANAAVAAGAATSTEGSATTGPKDAAKRRGSSSR